MIYKTHLFLNICIMLLYFAVMKSVETASSRQSGDELTSTISGLSIEVTQSHAPSLIPYTEALNPVLADYKHLLVGGLPIDVFNDPATEVVYNPAGISRLIAAPTFDTPLLRGNGSVRDLDGYVIGYAEDDILSRIPDERQQTLKNKLVAAAAVQAIFNENKKLGYIEKEPEMSVFSFETAAKTFRSATLVDESGKLYLAHGFVYQPLPAAALTEQWQLELPNGVALSVINPWEQLWRSMIRFSSGAKPKDITKLTTMLTRLKSIDGLKDYGSSELCQAYSQFYQDMKEATSVKRVKEEYLSPDVSWSRVSKTAVLSLASTVLEVGQLFDGPNAFVQKHPNIFNLFTGTT
jgi:hypothetical protein